MQYHFVLVTKYRTQILTDEIAAFVDDTIRNIAADYGIEIIALDVVADHVYLFLRDEPSRSPSRIAQMMKSLIARKTFAEYPELKKNELWGGEFWTDSYYVGSAGDVSAGTIERYVRRAEEV